MQSSNEISAADKPPLDELNITIFMKLLKHLYIQVLIGIALGIFLGILAPTWASSLKPFADLFIKLIKMMITPVIFLSLVSGIAVIHDMKTVGKIGGAALVYFIITTSFALALGLLIANVFQPGYGINIEPMTLDISAAHSYIGSLEHIEKISDFILNIIPVTFFSAFTEGEILQVLFVAILFALGLIAYGQNSKPIIEFTQHLAKIFFKIIHAIMYYAPIAAFATMAYTIAQYGAHSLIELAELLICFYLTCILFIFGVLGCLLYFYCGINIIKLIKYIKAELLIVFGTSSSETVLPALIEKLSKLGCDKSVVGLVLPTGYSFNLDGTAIYLTLAALFIAQATNSDLTFIQQLFLLLVMIISSKGAAGVAGSGFVILASSLAAIGVIPVAGVVIILGVDRFMSEGRALTNVIGNTVATLVIAKWQKAMDTVKVKDLLDKHK